MSIGKNIAKYRKIKNITQDELGKILGVTNQSVSKWENDISMPDILLLPEIAGVLGISLDSLYGLEHTEIEKGKVTADDFPDEAFDCLRRMFYDSSAVRFTCTGNSDEEQMEFQKHNLENGQYLGCYSNTGGAVIIRDSCSFIDRTYKLPESEKIFSNNRIANTLKYLSDKNLRKVLEYEYRINFEKSMKDNSGFTVSEISAECDLSEEDTERTLELLILLNLNEPVQMSGHDTEYMFVSQNVLYALTIFKLAEMMTDDKVWHVIRDTSIISDYTF